MDIKELVQKCIDNNREGQSTVYQLYAPKLYGTCLKYARNKEEAEDNLHDGFVTIFKKMSQYTFKGSFEGWMRRIMINTSLEKYRKQKNVYPIDAEPVGEDTAFEIETENVDLQLLLSCIQTLPDRYRLVFNLYVLDGFSHKEIAEMLKISENTSKSNLSRARGLLRKKLENENVKRQNYL